MNVHNLSRTGYLATMWPTLYEFLTTIVERAGAHPYYTDASGEPHDTVNVDLDDILARIPEDQYSLKRDAETYRRLEGVTAPTGCPLRGAVAVIPLCHDEATYIASNGDLSGHFSIDDLTSWLSENGFGERDYSGTGVVTISLGALARDEDDAGDDMRDRLREAVRILQGNGFDIDNYDVEDVGVC